MDTLYYTHNGCDHDARQAVQVGKDGAEGQDLGILKLVDHAWVGQGHVHCTSCGG